MKQQNSINGVGKKTAGKTVPPAILIAVLLVYLPSSAAAEDWPTCLHDICRTGVTSEVLTLPLAELWTYETVRAPEPAWTESPAVHDYYHGWYDLKPRQNFDTSAQIATVGNYVYYGCSKSGAVNCLNASTGKRAWTFFTEGPVRFAPTVANGKVYFGSDDGYVYCVGALDGALIWSERVGGEDMIWGNEHMISVWPVRSSVLVDGSDVFWAAGIFPEEGMYLCKRNAADGSGGWTVTPSLPPQGLLLATSNSLFVTSGKTYPTMYSRTNGAYQGSVQVDTRDGGSWALLTPDESDFWTGPSVENNTRQFGANTRAYIASVAAANRLIADAQYVYYNTDTKIFKINRSDRSLVWSIDYVYPYAIIKAGNTIFAGGDGEIAAFDGDGTRLWTASVNGKAYGLAAANGNLYASTDTGYIHCFSGTIPHITNSQGASNVTFISAHLNGYLESEGGSAATVYVHWGNYDGGTNPNGWENTRDLGTKSVGPLSVPVDQLSHPALYYYRFRAVNSYGASWAPASAVFITGAVTIQATDAEASEFGSNTGTFTVYRPTGTTGAALEVQYTVNGTAEPGNDYEPLSGQVVFEPQATEATITVTPIEDLVLAEPNETVVVTLAPGGYVIGDPNTAIVTISDYSGLEGWSHKMKIQFTGYTQPETLSNFPALIIFNETLDDFAYSDFASPTGGDLRFTNSDYTLLLNYEIEKWDIAGNSYIWVQVPQIADSSDYIWAFWGNPQQTTPPDYTTDGSTWSSGYTNVWHLHETSGTHYDSTGNGNLATPENGVNQNAVGVSAGADQFDGDNDQLTLTSVLPIGSSSNTVSAWLKAPTVGSGGLASGERVGIVLGNYSSNPICNWELHSSGQMRFYWNGGEIDQYGTTDMRDNTWHHVAWVRDKATGSFYMYIDGNLEKTIVAVGSDVVFSSTHKIGADNRPDPPNFHGFMDEIRVSNLARSPYWLWACYKNQVPNSTFITYGDAPPPNLIAYWPWDATLNNAQGNPVFDGTSVGNAVVSNNDVKIGAAALKINDNTAGINYVDITSTVLVNNVPTVNTIVAWYKYLDISSNGSDARNFIWETAPANFSLSFAIRSDTGDGRKHAQWFYEGSSGSQSSNANNGPIVDDGLWHHVAMVWNQNTGRIKFYHDGSIAPSDGNVAITLPGLNLSPTGFHIGNHRAGDGARNWDGYIDDMAIYDVELNSTQIQALFTGSYLGQNINAGNVLNIVP